MGAHIRFPSTCFYAHFQTAVQLIKKIRTMALTGLPGFTIYPKQPMGKMYFLKYTDFQGTVINNTVSIVINKLVPNDCTLKHRKTLTEYG